MATSTLQPLTTPSLHHTLQLSATKPHRHCTTIKSHSVSKCSLDSTTNLAPKPNNKRRLVGVGIGLLAASMLISSPLDANATRIEYYATVAEPSCELQFAPSGLGYCDVAPGFGVEAPYYELINMASWRLDFRFGELVSPIRALTTKTRQPDSNNSRKINAPFSSLLNE